MTWLRGLLGFRAHGELPVTSAKGHSASLLGNPHGRPDSVLVSYNGGVASWRIRDVVANSSRSIAWLAGYRDGFMLDPDDFWPTDATLSIESRYQRLEQSLEKLRRTLIWTDPEAAEVNLSTRVSPYERMSYSTYCDEQLISKFLLASTRAWWQHFEWRAAEDQIARAHPSDASREPEVENDSHSHDERWTAGDAVVSNGLLVAMSLTAANEHDAANGLLTLFKGRLGWGGEEYSFPEPTRYPVGMAVIGDDNFELCGDRVHVGSLHRSAISDRVTLDGVGSIATHLVMPYGALSAWWLRGYMAGREPTPAHAVEVYGDAASSYHTWRMIVLLHHLRRGVELAADPNDLERISEL